MNCEEAKDILLLYRHHHPADEQDPQITGALASAKHDSELAAWLEMHCARQFVLREKFRQIPVPDGLKEQILSEHAASRRREAKSRWPVIALALAVVTFFTLAIEWLDQRRPADDTLAAFQNQMASVALRGYAMDLVTDDAEKIRAYLKEKKAPADFVLPEPLKLVAQSGCAIQGWRNTKASMICFRTGQPLPPGAASDLWLFVMDENSVKNAPAGSTPQFAKVNRLITATWTKDGKIYLLGMEGEAANIRKFL